MVKSNPQSLLRESSNLLKEGNAREALSKLRCLMRDAMPTAEEIDRAGRLIRKALETPDGGERPLKIAMIGQLTTAWLSTALTAVAWGNGVPVTVREGGYDTVLQDLANLPTEDGRPDVVVLLPWNQRLLGGHPPGERIQNELAVWTQAWKMVHQNGARILQASYDWILPSARGIFLDGQPPGLVHTVRTLNEEIRAHLPTGAYHLDLEQVSGAIGREVFYDLRRYYWTKQPFSEQGTAQLAKAVWSGIRALTSGPKKVLVVDLDNTLWGGVVGETGPLGVALGDSPDGESFRAFQAYLKDLKRQGIVLAVASKNNPNDAREVFAQHPDMILRLDDFAALEINWEPKAVTIKRIAETLSLGLDSFVFFDDNPAEGELIRQALPDVEVVAVPSEPADYVRALQAGGWFETTGLTQEDASRSEQYVVERKRRELQTSFSSLDDYLRSLRMSAEVLPLDEADMMRVVQLLAKTNQFNLTTRRHTREDVMALINTSGSIALTLRVQDHFGDYGLVSLMIGVPAGELGTIRIDTWLMSCRVIGRTVEQFFFGVFLARCKELCYRRILGELIPTKKNALVANLYDELGFERMPGDNGTAYYQLFVDRAEPPVSFVSDRTSAANSPKPNQA